MSRKIVAVIEKFKDATRYVEPFGGAGTIFFAKEPHLDEVYNDLYGAYVNFFAVLKDDDARERLLYKTRLVPCCRALFRESFKRQKKYRRVEGVLDVDAAFDLFYSRNYCFHGVTHSFGGSQTERAAYQNKLDALHIYAERFKKVLIEGRDFRDIFRIYDSKDSLFYCDPPYETFLSDTSKEYLTNWKKQDEIDFVDLIINGKGRFVVSCYDNENYRRLLDCGYERLDYEASCSCDLKAHKRIESVYWRPSDVNDGRLTFF